MSDQSKLLLPNEAEQMAKRYLIAKGYYHKGTVPTHEVYEMLIEYTAHIQQRLDLTLKHAMDLMSVQPLPTIIIPAPNKKNNSLDILSDKKETVTDEES